MAFLLNVSGPDLFTLSNQATQPTDLIDPAILFHADFLGAKILKYSLTVNCLTDYTSIAPYPSDSGYTYETDSTIMLGKTFTKMPFVMVCGYSTNKSQYYGQNSSFSCYDSNGSNASTYGLLWQWRKQNVPNNQPGYLDGVTVTSYDFKGIINVYVVDGP